MDAIPDYLLKFILPRIDSPLCVIRAASTCKSWRRIITHDAFLSRVLSLHSVPPVAGVYYEGSHQASPAEPPGFVASPVAASIASRHFSLDFLPANGDTDACRPWAWRIVDSRGSLLLLVNRRTDDGEGSTSTSTSHQDQHVIICEPATQRSERIPPCTESGVGSGYVFICAYLLDGTGDTGDGNRGGARIGMSNFRVLCVVYGDSCYHAFVFTSSVSCWSEISINVQMMVLMTGLFGLDAASQLSLLAGESGSQRMDLMGLTSASLYWYTGRRTVVALDRAEAAVTSFVLPDVEDWDRLSLSGSRMRVADGPDGKVRLVVSEAGGILKVFARLHGGHGQWALEKSMSVQLPPAVRAAPSHSKPWEILTTCVPLIAVSPYNEGMWRLCLDGEFAKAEAVPGVPYPCELPWPPVFRACCRN